MCNDIFCVQIARVLISMCGARTPISLAVDFASFVYESRVKQYSSLTELDLEKQFYVQLSSRIRTYQSVNFNSLKK